MFKSRVRDNLRQYAGAEASGNRVGLVWEDRARCPYESWTQGQCYPLPA